MAYQFKPFEKAVGTFVVLSGATVLLASLLVINERNDVFSSKKGIYYAHYNSGNDVKPKMDVLYNGFKIGKTDQLEFLPDDRVKVRIKVDAEYTNRVKADSVAHIMPSIMGGASIVITKGRPTSPPHEVLATILSSDEPEGRQMEREVGGKVIPPAMPDRIVGNIMGLTDILQNENGPVVKLLDSLTDILRQNIDPQSTLGRMLGAIRKILEDSAYMVAQIKAGEGSIGALIEDKAFYNRLQSIMRSVDELSKSSTVLVRNLSTMPLLNGDNTRNPTSRTIDGNERADGYARTPVPSGTPASTGTNK